MGIAATMILPIKDNLNGHQLIQEELAMQSKINKEIFEISQKIKRISYGHSKEYIRKISKYIYKSSEKYNINEDILLKLICPHLYYIFLKIYIYTLKFFLYIL